MVTINSSLAFEVQPLEDYNHPQEDMGEVGGGSGGGSDQDLHLLFSADTSEGNGARSCGVSHAAVPPIHSSSHMRRVSSNSNYHDALHPQIFHVFSVFQSKRDILSETKYIELVLVADHQEVSENTTANDNKNDLININNFFIYIFSSLATHNVNGAKKELSKDEETVLGGLLVAG